MCLLVIGRRCGLCACHSCRGGVAYVPVTHSKGSVVSVPVSHNKGGVPSVPVTHNKGGVYKESD